MELDGAPDGVVGKGKYRADIALEAKEHLVLEDLHRRQPPKVHSPEGRMKADRIPQAEEPHRSQCKSPLLNMGSAILEQVIHGRLVGSCENVDRPALTCNNGHHHQRGKEIREPISLHELPESDDAPSGLVGEDFPNRTMSYSFSFVPIGQGTNGNQGKFFE